MLTENRNGLVISACVTEATGTAEREAAEQMLRKSRQNRSTAPHDTVGADKNYDTKGFIAKVRDPECHPACGPEPTATAPPPSMGGRPDTRDTG